MAQTTQSSPGSRGLFTEARMKMKTPPSALKGKHKPGVFEVNTPWDLSASQSVLS